MTAWREQSFWSKVGALAAWVFLMMLPGYPESDGLDRDRYGRKRIFSPGFVALCALAVVFELVILNHFYGAGG